MENFNFYSPVKIHFGKDSLNELPALVQNQRVLLISGGGAIKAAGIYAQIMDKILPVAKDVLELPGQKRATQNQVSKNITLANAKDINVVIGAGGATVMDMAKLIAFGLKNDGLNAYLDGSVQVTAELRALTILIPTYPSTGSEVDNLSDVEEFNGNQHGVLSNVYADYALLNPEFTYSLDTKNTAFSAIVTFI